MRNEFKNWKQPKFHDDGTTNWHWKCQHNENLSLGEYVDVGSYTYINAKKSVKIGEHVQIGSHCSIYSISTIDNKEGPVNLEKNCRIGSHSVIMPNVTIGKNSIIGAFSFVNRDIPENVVAFGIPVKVVRKLTPYEIKRIQSDIE